MIRTLLTALLILIGSCNVYGIQGIPWNDLRSAYRDYLEHPTKQNANKLLSILPSNRPDADEEMNGIFEEMYMAYPRLSKIALSGNEKAEEVLFKLLTLTDGAFSEDISIDIGSLIRRSPEKFLEYLKKYRKNIRRLDSLLGNLGPDYVDKFTLQLQELQLRKKSIESVESPNLLTVKEECIKELNRKIKLIKNILKETPERLNDRHM